MVEDDLSWQYEEIDGDYNPEEERQYYREQEELSRKKKEVEELNRKLGTNFTLERLETMGITPKEAEMLYRTFVSNLSQLRYLDDYSETFLNQLKSYINLEKELSKESLFDWTNNCVEFMNMTNGLFLLKDSVRDYLQVIYSLLPQAISKADEHSKLFLIKIKKNIEQYLKLYGKPSYKYYSPKGYYKIPKKYPKAYDVYGYPYYERYGLTTEELSDKSEFDKYILIRNKIINNTMEQIREGRKPTIVQEWKPHEDLSLAERLAKTDAERILLFGNQMGRENTLDYIKSLEANAREQLISTAPRDVRLIKEAVSEISKEEEELAEKKPIVELTDHQESLSMEKFNRELDAKYSLEKAIDYLISVGKKKRKELE